MFWRDPLDATPPPAASERADTRLAWVVFLVALSLTGLVWLNASREMRAAAEERFARRVSEIHDQISDRLSIYAHLLNSASGLLRAVPAAGRDAWTSFVGDLDLEARFPGVPAVAFAAAVTDRDTDRLVAEARADGIDGFRIWPAQGEGGLRVINLYAAPVNGMNLRALGFDLMSEPIRRRAVEAARDGGTTSVTGTITLKIDETSRPQPAFIMFAPVYRFNATPRTVDERRGAFQGVVLSPIRLEPMFATVLALGPGDMAVAVHDNTPAPVFRSHPERLDAPMLTATRELRVGGRVWTVRFESRPPFETSLQGGWPMVLLAVGVAISVLLFLIVWGLVTNRSRAMALARRMTSSLRRRETELNQLFSQSPLGIALIGTDGRIVDCNDAVVRMLGLPRPQLIGYHLGAGLGDGAVSTAIDDALGGEPRSLETGNLLLRDGRRGPFNLHVQPVYDGADFLFVLCFLEDIGERKRAEQHVHFLAHYDALTGLPNRVLLYERLKQELARARRERTRVAALFIDLDRFKVINDSLGHSFGDEFLRSIAQRLRLALPDGDLVGRLGGDEFLVVSASCSSPADAGELAETLRRELGRPVMLNGQPCVLSPSIGIALFPDDAQDAEGLIRGADIAMYSAKDAGRDTHRFVTAEMGTRSRERLDVEANLRHALDSGQLFLAYQPQVRIADGTLAGLEALIRWHHPENGAMLPGRFLRVAEESGLILPIGDWVVNEVCRQIREWQGRIGLTVPVAVNISGVQFRDDQLPTRILAALDAHGLKGPELEIEVTESVLIQNLDSTAATLRALKQRGVLVALDDFGTGYSSLSYLHRFPIDTLKIDRSFIMNLEADPMARSIPRAVIGLGTALGLSVVAEGVETPGQLAVLAELKCDLAQGYLFGRPLPAAETEPLLAAAVLRPAERQTLPPVGAA